MTNITATSREATFAQIDDVYLFLNKYFTENKSGCGWKALFNHKWARNEPYGYVLIDEAKNDKIVGFIGTIFADRLIDGKNVKTCCLTSWAVDKKYRGKGLSLVTDLVKRKGVLFLDFSANDASRRIFERYKFEQLEKEEWTFFSVPFFGSPKKVYKDYNDVPAELINENDRKFVEDNRTRCVNHEFMDFFENGKLLVVYKKIIQKKLSFIEILYISSSGMENNSIIKALSNLAFRKLAFGFVVDSRHIGDTRIPHIRKPVKYKIYKNNMDDEIELSKIDLLYSEKIFLN